MFNRKKNITLVNKITDDNIIKTSLYKTNGKTFKLLCDARKAGATIGINANYSLSLLTDNGFVLLFDNRQLNINEIKFDNNQIDKINNQIDEGFEYFRVVADTL